MMIMMMMMMMMMMMTMVTMIMMMMLEMIVVYYQIEILAASPRVFKPDDTLLLVF